MTLEEYRRISEQVGAVIADPLSTEDQRQYALRTLHDAQDERDLSVGGRKQKVRPGRITPQAGSCLHLISGEIIGSAYPPCGSCKRKIRDLLSERQGGLCKCCGRELTRNRVLDHCHRTNRIRGVICNACNTGLGMFRDDVATLSAAITYLGAH